ncbi:hypothetical protein Y023_5907 [Burkholderia pseudomallei A79D]|nr:hypothetical protein X942_6053 [Burkholderia pseudomallei MSHR5596]KGX94269.1 hypothetical protein Y023_5907 [Burkholderia pseudomallei A79D]KGX94698.1 hypothetical protein X997_5756 [Burkholderia pseudomallei A79C]
MFIGSSGRWRRRVFPRCGAYAGKSRQGFDGCRRACPRSAGSGRAFGRRLAWRSVGVDRLARARVGRVAARALGSLSTHGDR